MSTVYHFNITEENTTNSSDEKRNEFINSLNEN